MSVALHVPQALAERPQWVVYRMEAKPGRPKPTKVPYRADGRGPASSTDPGTWAPIASALNAAPRFDGLGFVFAPDDGLWGLDLDGCCPEPFGPAVPEADLLVRALATYAEHSPSGTGLHAICAAVHPDGARNKAPLSPDVDAEAYDRGRYFTFTGRQYGRAAEVEPRQHEVDALARVSEDGTRALFAPKERRMSVTPPSVARAVADESDGALLRRMFDATNGGAVERLYRGDRSAYGSPSEADAALVSHLLFWTGGDGGRADRLFRSSGLMRPKWDEMRGAVTYGERTIDAVGGATR